MSEYIVSARKYRPMTFDTVVGQGAIATTLKNAIRSDKLAHAYLFCGPRGVGKTTCARIFAKTINCMNPREDGEACNECESCQAFNDGRSLNIHELDAASNNSVDDIRNLIDQVRIPPQIGKYKVFIIDEVHMLSAQAFNAFLKTLEEPPAHAIFILATTEKHKILPTILSRCQIYDFQRMTVADIAGHLARVAEKEGYTYEDTALNIIAQKADGGMRDALSIFDQVVSYTGGNITYQQVIENLNVLDYDYYFRLVDFMLEKKISESLLLFNEILGKGFEGGPFISGLASHLRDLLVSHDPQTTQLLEASEEIRQRYVEQAKRCKVQWLYHAIRLCNDCDQAYRTSRNKRLQVELTLIECAQATDDDVSGGRRPTRRLKPIFSLLAAAAQAGSTPTAATASTSTATPTASSTSAVATPATEAAAPPVPQPPSPNRDTDEPQKAAAPVASSTVKHPRLNLSALNPVIHTPRPVVHQSSAPQKSAEPSAMEKRPFTQTELNTQWFTFIGTMGKEDTAIAQIMKILQPMLQDDGTTVVVAVENEEIARMIQELLPRLRPFLCEQLHNSGIVVKLTVAEPVQTQAVTYDKREQLRRFCQMNPALITLGKNLKLELS
jgi:DNA polymerase-3 subunit gamma/tau